jgi:cleavage and polyadenylation specificity factor subunit 1
LQDVEVVGNLVVAGGADLRVFEVRESKVAVVENGAGGEHDDGDVKQELGDYLDTAPVKVCILYSTYVVLD